MTTATANGSSSLIDVQPALLAQWIEQRQAVLIDVREDFEHAAERIPGAENWPLSRLDPGALQDRFRGRKIVFHCRSGKRSAEAASRCRLEGEPAFQLAGGIEGWKAAGLETLKPASGPRIDVMRQVQIVVGTLVVAGVLLGAFLSPWYLLISGFVGAGLVFAGLTGTCGMALLLAKMPWNHGPASCRRSV
jgi:rhodanese-related sulfurtransferase